MPDIQIKTAPKSAVICFAELIILDITKFRGMTNLFNPHIFDKGYPPEFE